MSDIEILSLGKSDIGCTKERWREVFKDYLPTIGTFYWLEAGYF